MANGFDQCCQSKDHHHIRVYNVYTTIGDVTINQLTKCQKTMYESEQIDTTLIIVHVFNGGLVFCNTGFDAS